MTAASEAALWREHGREPPARPLPLPSIVPPVERPSLPASWAPRALVVECLATGEPLDRVARMLGLRSVDDLAPVLARHGLERWTTNGGVMVVGARVEPVAEADGRSL